MATFEIRPVLDGRRWIVRIDGKTLMNKAAPPYRGPIRFGSRAAAIKAARKTLIDAGLLTEESEQV